MFNRKINYFVSFMIKEKNGQSGVNNCFIENCNHKVKNIKDIETWERQIKESKDAEQIIILHFKKV